MNHLASITCVKPEGALYVFPRIDVDAFGIKDDQQFAFDLLRAEKVLIVQGSGFNWPDPDHFRIVTLPQVDVLTEAIGRIGNFLSSYHQ